MGEARNPKRLCRRGRHGATLSRNDRGGKGTRIARQDGTDAIRDPVPQGEQCRIETRDQAFSIIWPGHFRLGRAEEEADGPDPGEIALKGEVVQTGQGGARRRREPSAPAQPVSDRSRCMFASGQQAHPLRRPPNGRLHRPRQPQRVAPLAGRTLLPALDKTGHGGDERLVDDDRRNAPRLPFREQHPDGSKAGAPENHMERRVPRRP